MRYIPEGCVKGFVHFKVPQKPPGRSVVLLQHEDGSHAGYATCVQTLQGVNALITAEHAWSKAAFVASTSLPHKIKTKDFVCGIVSQTDDFVMVFGPTSWESLLGCKAVPIITADRLAQGPALFYNLGEDGKWQANNAHMVGSAVETTKDGHKVRYITVDSNTKKGDSGTGLFVGKSLVGVHVGWDKQHGVNLAVPIPVIPEWTKPAYEYETTNVRGLLFTSDEIAGVAQQFDDAYSKLLEQARSLITFKGKRGNWYDYEEEVAAVQPAPSAPVMPSPTPSEVSLSQPSGNERVAPSTSKTGKGTPDVAYPVVDSSPISNEGMMRDIMNALVSRVNVEKIEKSLQKTLEKKTRKTRRGRKSGAQKKQPEISKPSSPPNTPGKYQPPHKRQASPALGKSTASTTLPPRKNQNGGQNSHKPTQNWVRKQGGSVGPNLGRKQN